MTKRKLPNRAGVSIYYVAVVVSALIAMASLAVDYGRVSLARSELQSASDAAASAAIARLNSGREAARTAAIEVAGANRCDGAPVVLDPALDVEFGRWSSKTKSFTVATGFVQPNAVRVTARRIAARSNAIQLPLGRLIGMPQCDVSATAVASRLRYSLVGIDSVKLSGTALIDSYDSSEGPYGSSTRGDNVTLVSNGDIDLGSNCTVKGDAHPGPGKTVLGAEGVTGSTAPLPKALVFPMPTLDPSYNNLLIQSWLDSDNDLDLSGKTFVIPPGIYYVRNIELASNASMLIQGEVTFYVAGDIRVSGGIDLGGLPPGSFRIRAINTGGTVEIRGNASLHADLYAPGSTVSVIGTGDFYGTLVGKTLDLTGVAGIHGDDMISPFGGSGFMTLVQ